MTRYRKHIAVFLVILTIVQMASVCFAMELPEDAGTETENISDRETADIDAEEEEPIPLEQLPEEELQLDDPIQEEDEIEETQEAELLALAEEFILPESHTEYGEHRFSVSIPTSLPIYINENGECVSGGFTVSNDGTDAVCVTSSKVVPADGWSISESEDFGDAVGIHKFCFYIDGYAASSDGSISAPGFLEKILPGGGTSHEYEGKVPFQGDRVEETIGYCLFTVEEVVLSGGEITKLPDTLTYDAGSVFDPAGLVVTAFYSDGTDALAENISFPDGMSLLPDQRYVTTVLTEGSVSVYMYIPVEVRDSAVELRIQKAPDKTVYRPGEAFDPTGLIVSLLRSSGSEEVVTDYTIPDGSSLALGQEYVTVLYTEGDAVYTAAVPIEVVNPPVSLSLEKLPVKTNYSAGESFASAGMVLTVQYADGSRRPEDGYEIEGGNPLVSGTDHVTAVYREGGYTLTCSVPVHVSSKFSLTLPDSAVERNTTAGNSTATLSGRSGGYRWAVFGNMVTIPQEYKGYVDTVTFTYSASCSSASYSDVALVAYGYDLSGNRINLTNRLGINNTNISGTVTVSVRGLSAICVYLENDAIAIGYRGSGRLTNITVSGTR